MSSETAGHKADMHTLTLHSVLSPSVFTVTPDTLLSDVLTNMQSLRIPCAVAVDDAHHPVGIFTEHDALGLMATHSPVHTLSMASVMRSPALTAPADLDFRDAYQLICDKGAHHLVVVDDGNCVIGIVSEAELLHATLESQRQDLQNLRNQIEQTRQQLLYHGLIEQLSDAIFVSQEKSGQIIDCNTHACRSLGYTRDELLRLTIFDIATAITPGASWDAELSIFARDGRRLSETLHRRRDGSVFPVEVNATLVLRGNERYIVAVARDLSERKQAETALHLKNTALNSTANAIVITDKDGVIEWANPAFTEMTGFSLDEALGKRPKELVKTGIQPREFYEALWNTILSGKVWRGEVVNKRKNGTLYTEEMTITPVYTADKVITHFIAVKQDISLRKEAERKLSQSETSYRGIINSISEAVYIQNEQGVFIDVNQGASTMYGYTRDELIGATPEFVSAPGKNDLAATMQAIQRAYTGVPQQFDFWGKRKDGSIFPKSVNLVSGTYFGKAVVIAVARDISAQKLAEENLMLSEQTYREMIDSVSDAVCIRSADGLFLDVNRASAEMYGCKREEMIGQKIEAFLSREENDWNKISCALEAANAGKPNRIECVALRKNGASFPIEVSVSGGQYFGKPAIIAVSHEITQRRAEEDKLREAAAVMQNTHEGVMITDASANLIAVNAAFSNITGYTQAEVLGKNPRLLSSGRQSKPFYEAMWKGLLEHGFWQGELWNRRKSGAIYPQLLTLNTIYNEKQQPVRYIGVFADITQLKENQAKLEFMANHDPLTQLPNRTLAESRLEQELELALRHKKPLSVLFIDLDRFKQVNDSFGHLVGDELLCSVAARLNARLREGDTLGRLGGDEFVLIASPLQEKQDAAIIARDFINALGEPFELSNGVEVFIGGSIGISLFPDNGTTVAELTRNADAAMYMAKESGRNQFSFYTPELNADARNKLEMENKLRRAILHNELSLHYQPKVDLLSGCICGAEALARWQLADGNWIPPDQFIPLAEKSGVILTIGNWVLEQVCMQIRKWLDSGLPVVCIAVNVSARQFRSGHLDKLVKAALDKFNVPPHYIELELTESMLMHEPARAIEIMQKLKEIGVKISLDDFGTGYSSLAYLRHLPIDSLKIDQSFVQGIHQHPEDRIIVDTIIDLARRMQMRVVGEGVETTHQLAYLQENHCNELQGFLFSAALHADDFATLLRSGKKLER